MTSDEAKIVAGVVSEADGQCFYCAAALARSLAQSLPDFDWYQLVADAGRWSREQMVDPDS